MKEGASDWRWEQEYDDLLRQGRETGDFGAREQGAERRVSPRFRIKSEYVWIKVEPRFQVVNVSVSGMSLYSDFPFKLGENINITLGKAFSVEAEVIDCTLVESDPVMMEHKYLVRSKFGDEYIGMQFLVMIKEMNDLEIGM